MFAHMSTFMRVCMQGHVCMCVYSWIHMCICMHAHTHTCARKGMCASMWTHGHVCIQVCTHPRMFACKGTRAHAYVLVGHATSPGTASLGEQLTGSTYVNVCEEIQRSR